MEMIDREADGSDSLEVCDDALDMIYLLNYGDRGL
jgi:hypothetical protein